jgi:tetratricopeptide (TPR) repeat protein
MSHSRGQAFALAEQHFRAGRFSAAMALCCDILRVHPDWAPALHLYGLVTHKTNNLPVAIDLLRRAIGADGANARYHNDLSWMYRLAGQLPEALIESEKAIALNQREPAYYFYLSSLKTFAPGDPHLAAMEGLAGTIASLSDVSRIHLHFALAKAYEDLGRYDESFQQLEQGNALKRRQIVYNETAMHRAFERIKEVFDRRLIDTNAKGGYRSQIPVFVVGMPRSGTTLVEQILASHPLVFGAGEIPAFGHLVQQLRTGPARSIEYPDCVPSLSADQVCELGENYITALRRQDPRAARVSDKMPMNFLYLGLIHLALPEARIVHVVRNPLDTCLSCYSKLFRAGQRFTYDLTELGHYYRDYAELMAHWSDVLPSGRLLEISYEAVIADLETEARRLVTFCGLPWDPRCLAFYQARRPVFTASAAQVRRPIYQSSEGRWRAYNNYLGPLITALGDGPNL